MMPHSVHSASSLEDESGDPLQGSLAGLSLTDTHETGEVESEPSRFNPFEAFLPPAPETGPLEDNSGASNPFAPLLTTSTRERGLVQSIEDLTQDVIPQHLDGLQQPRRFTLDETDALYAQGRKFQEKWGVSEEAFLNWKSLLSGFIEFPAVMLLNPSPWDHVQQFYEMVDRSSTLSWLRNMFAETQLGLNDVIIFDMFPMLRDDLRDDVLKRMGPAKLEELARESFALTRASLELIRPRVLISCQCCTNPRNERWGFFCDVLARQLCSSVEWAKSGQVQRVDVSGHRMHVVRGMHPQYVVQREPNLERVLAGLFMRVFEPFGAWQSRRMAAQQGLQYAGAVLSGQVVQLRRLIQLYRQLCGQAAGSGVEGPVAVERAEELGTQLAEWERGSSDGAA